MARQASSSALCLLALLAGSCALLAQAQPQTGLGTLGTTDGGSCGFLNWPTANVMVTGFSEAIYGAGSVCGGCWLVQCSNSDQCKPGGVVVTATNECMATNDTSPCTAPKSALNLSPTAYDLIAKSRAPGVVGATWTPVPCARAGGVQFMVTTGDQYYMSVLIQNVAGPGALKAVFIRAGAGALAPMTRSFGSVWQINNYDIVGKPISFVLVGYNNEKLLVPNALPAQFTPQKLYMTAYNYVLPKAVAPKKAVPAKKMAAAKRQAQKLAAAKLAAANKAAARLAAAQRAAAQKVRK